MARIGGIVRESSDGTAVTDGTDVVITDSAGATVATVETTDGVWEYETNLNPKGQLDATVTLEGVPRTESSRAYRQVGPLSVAELPAALRALGTGVVDGYGNELAVTATGTRQVAVNTGAAIVDGVPCVVYSSASPATAGTANSSGSTRSDCLVLRVVRPGYDENEGKSELVIVEGSSSAPADTDQYAYLRLASMTLADGGTSYTVTDQRTYAGTAIAVPGNEATQTAFLRSTASQTFSSTTPAAVTGATAAVTLSNGVDYEVLAEASCLLTSGSGDTEIAVYVGSSGEMGGYLGFAGHVVTNGHAATVSGTGAAVTCGVYARRSTSLSSGTVERCFLRVTAIPRAV